ncbi:MFS transporter [Paenibacillus sp.]|uniref:MFS transporter n=1 Tax=Paenibacillus sp. TaxID=58172 RepID=UPI00281278C5|nr:MFS transporter [Paenibacillus sp.]
MLKARQRSFFGRLSSGNAFVWKLLFIMFSIEFVKGALLVSVLPVYFSRELGLSAYVLGWAFALQYVGDNAFRAPVGWMIDRFGYRLPMSAGLSLGFAGVAALAWLDGPGWMLAGCFLLGAGTSPLWPCVVAGTTEASGASASGRAMSAIYIASFVGTGAGPIAINYLAAEDEMRLPFLVCLALSAAALAAGLLLPGRPFAPVAGKRAAAPGSMAAGMLETLRGVPGGALLYPAMFLQTLALGLLTPVVTLYAREDLGLRPDEFSVLLLTGGGASLLLLLLVGRLADKYGTRAFLLAGIPLTAASTAGFAAVANRSQLFLAVVAVAIGYALLIPAWNAFVAGSIPKQRRGAAWGAFLAIEGSGFVVGPIVSGWLWESWSHRAPFLASGAASAALFVLYLFISFRKSDVLR